MGYALGVFIDPGLGVYTKSLAQSQGLGICIGSTYRVRDWGYALAVLIEPGTGGYTLEVWYRARDWEYALAVRIETGTGGYTLGVWYRGKGWGICIGGGGGIETRTGIYTPVD